MTALIRVETVPIDALLDWPGNARRHDTAALDESIEHHGQYRTIVTRELPDGRLQILAGHGTRDALARAGHATVEVEVRDVPDDTTARRIVLMDNAAADRAGWDQPALLALLDAAAADGGLAGTGYTDDAYRALLDEAGSENPHDWDPGAVDEQDLTPPTEPITRLGDTWTIGRHTLTCGDALDGTVVTRLMPRAPDVVYTDPPYGISIVSRIGGDTSGTPIGKVGGGLLAKTRDYRPVLGDDTTETATRAFRDFTERYRGARHVWWGANHYAGDAHLPDASCWLVWDKQNGEIHFADAELAWTNHPGAVRIFRHMWHGMIRASERGPRVHPNQKPAALATWALDLMNPDATGLILDPFAGSGSTLLACEPTGRIAHCIELDPGYCDVIVRRWQDLTGQTATNSRLGPTTIPT